MLMALWDNCAYMSVNLTLIEVRSTFSFILNVIVRNVFHAAGSLSVYLIFWVLSTWSLIYQNEHGNNFVQNIAWEELATHPTWVAKHLHSDNPNYGTVKQIEIQCLQKHCRSTRKKPPRPILLELLLFIVYVVITPKCNSNNESHWATCGKKTHQMTVPIPKRLVQHDFN